MDYIALGQRVRCWRRKKKLTQERLAEMADMSASFLGHIERGSRTASLETLMKLCAALEVTPNELLGENLPAAARDLPERITISSTALLEGVAELLQKKQIL